MPLQEITTTLNRLAKAGSDDKFFRVSRILKNKKPVAMAISQRANRPSSPQKIKEIQLSLF